MSLRVLSLTLDGGRIESIDVSSPPLMPVLPPLPPPPSGGIIVFSPAAWRWLTGSVQLLYAASQAQFAVLGPLVNSMEGLMATVAELQAALDANTAATTAASAAITTEIAQLQAAIGALSTAQPPTQAQIDQLNASSTALETATAALVADDPAPA